jgi:hypothetical protein
VSTRYPELFRIQCRHRYFADQRCPALEVTPTPLCSRLLEGGGFLFRREPGGGCVYYDSSAEGQRHISRFHETSPFSFALTGSAAELASVTEMAPMQSGSGWRTIRYFCNLSRDAAAPSAGREVLLHPPGEPFRNANLPLRPPQFDLSSHGSVIPDTLRLFDMLGNKVPKIACKKEGADKPVSVVSLNLSGINEGRYLLQIHPGENYDFYLSSVAPSVRWGVIEIFAGGPGMPWIIRGGSVLGLDELGPVTFTICLEPRRSVWRYYIVSQSPADRTYDGYQILGTPPRGKANGTPPMAFSPPIREKLNGKNAWVFESKDPIPLYEYPPDWHEFTLRSNAPGAGFGPFALPYARPENTWLERGPNDQTRSCSEIYVYL